MATCTTRSKDRPTAPVRKDEALQDCARLLAQRIEDHLHATGLLAITRGVGGCDLSGDFQSFPPQVEREAKLLSHGEHFGRSQGEAGHLECRRPGVEVGPLTLHTHDGHLHFLIADNGRGVTEAERRKAEARGSFGLISMRARITTLGGEFNFDSSPETGTQISGWLPLSQ